MNYKAKKVHDKKPQKQKSYMLRPKIYEPNSKIIDMVINNNRIKGILYTKTKSAYTKTKKL